MSLECEGVPHNLCEAPLVSFVLRYSYCRLLHLFGPNFEPWVPRELTRACNWSRVGRHRSTVIRVGCKCCSPGPGRWRVFAESSFRFRVQECACTVSNSGLRLGVLLVVPGAFYWVIIWCHLKVTIPVVTPEAVRARIIGYLLSTAVGFIVVGSNEFWRGRRENLQTIFR